ncbi:hypothetical protein HJC23_006641 [Cyclotella cryptica]|uniref:Uncharacterized protein n=1 Tax=Cyclotella cryptica TaxID=29204 RepID=A0ABD3QXX7_9STRA|eukprot:CCRYP_001064-RA/>CCRYP_001064-RA protein AED:0.22 eAED:0.22 QI:0/-1/0/1/-1/1/1/0/311
MAKEFDISTANNEPHDQDDDVQEIDVACIPPPLFATASRDNQNDDDDLQIVGSTNCTILPHNRQDCIHPNSRFVAEDKPEADRRDNAKFCKLCYCYVCDKPARECEEWYFGGRGECIDDEPDGNSQDDVDQTEQEKKSGADGETSTFKSDVVCVTSFEPTAAEISATATNEATVSSVEAAGSITPQNASKSQRKNNQQPYKNHCHATDCGPNKHLWYNMRRAIRDGRDPSTVTSSVAERSQAELVAQMMQEYHENYHPTMHSTNQQSHERRRRSNPPTSNRRRVRMRNGSLRPGDHQQRIRAQAMLEDLYR